MREWIVGLLFGAGALFILLLGGCQGVVGPGGQLNGITVPPGCKAQGTISFPIATGALTFSCDETGVAPPPAGARMMLR